MERWAGKVAVVTGASAGIGVAIATDLVEHGMIVVGLARRVERIQELANSLKGKKGKLHAVKADLSKDEDIISAFQWIRKNIGVVHVLVNNAGYGPYCMISELGEADYKKIHSTFDLNVVGLTICTNEALKIMREKNVDDGHIFNINSVAGHYISRVPGWFAYNASKHAVTVLTEGLRRELILNKSNIRVTSISPGIVKTEFGVASGVPNLEEKLAQLPCLESKHISDSLIYALTAPANVQVHELTIRPVGETF